MDQFICVIFSIVSCFLSFSLFPPHFFLYLSLSIFLVLRSFSFSDLCRSLMTFFLLFRSVPISADLFVSFPIFFDLFRSFPISADLRRSPPIILDPWSLRMVQLFTHNSDRDMSHSNAILSHIRIPEN